MNYVLTVLHEISSFQRKDREMAMARDTIVDGEAIMVEDMIAPGK